MVKIELSKDEAIVLFDFLVRFNKRNHTTLFNDRVEKRVLRDIECILEEELAEPFLPEYLKILNKARKNIRDKN